MAGDQTDFLRIRVGDKLKKRLASVAKARGCKMSGLVRNVLEAACEAAESGDPLVAPLVVSSRKAKR